MQTQTGSFGRRTISAICAAWRTRTPEPKSLHFWGAAYAPAWEACCYGNAAEIERLLNRYVIGLGKRRNIGYGAVVGWWVLPWEDAGDPLLRDGKLAHAIPTAHAQAAGYTIAEPPVLVGWTPPLWNQALWEQGWPVGTPVQVGPPPIDWFAAADGLA